MAQKAMQAQKAQLDQIREALDQANCSVNKLQSLLEAEERSTTKLKASVTGLNATVAERNKTINALRTDVETERRARTAWSKRAAEHEQQLAEAELALQIVAEQERRRPATEQLTRPPPLLPAQPFVVMLVDGDGYKV